MYELLDVTSVKVDEHQLTQFGERITNHREQGISLVKEVLTRSIQR